MLDDLIKESKQIGVSCFTGYQCGHAADILDAREGTESEDRHERRRAPRAHVPGGREGRAVRRRGVAGARLPRAQLPVQRKAQRLWKLAPDLQYITSSGCPYGCTFCALRSAWTPRPLEQIEREIGAIHDLTGFKEVSFSDPNIGFDKTRVDGVNQKIDRIERLKGIGTILRKYGIRWDGNIRSDYVTPELVDVMAWSGCYSIEFGCESGNDEFLRKVIRKGHGIDSIKNANKCMAGSGISVMNSWVRGMPRETHEQWLDTMNLIDWIMDVAPEARASVYRFTPYPGGPPTTTRSLASASRSSIRRRR
jgi:radical SAM superfamily enzyme YgiQ (UPF0313 family)